MTIIVTTFVAPVASLTEEKQKVNWHKVDGTWQCDEVSIGWFMRLEGSWEKMNMGGVRPDIAVGDKIKVTMEKVT